MIRRTTLPVPQASQQTAHKFETFVTGETPEGSISYLLNGGQRPWLQSLVQSQVHGFSRCVTITTTKHPTENVFASEEIERFIHDLPI
jgi:hypothetical protein